LKIRNFIIAIYYYLKINLFMKENLIQQKTYDFALKIINTSKQMQMNKEYVLARQLLKSGTSIGANVEEAIGGQSRKDFLSKISIAYKEARETKFWLRLLRDSNSVDTAHSEELIYQVDEILRIIGSIQRTTKSKLSD
jgi:four helix bundle protein